MGKNKKNRSQNFVNLDANSDDGRFTTISKTNQTNNQTNNQIKISSQSWLLIFYIFYNQ